MNALLLLTAVVVAQPQLTLWPNVTEISQCDHLVVKTLLLNNTDHDVTVEHKGTAGNYFSFQYKVDGKWVSLAPMSMYWGVGARMKGPDPVVKPDATFAEYDTIHLCRPKLEELFVFDRPGEFELRAYGWSSGDSIVSQTVKITVKARTPRELERIGGTEKLNFGILGTRRLSYTPLPGLVDLADVGGNLGSEIQNLQLMERIVSGEEKTGDDVFKYVREHMGPINAQVAFHILGHHYRKKGDLAQLEKVVAELRDKTIAVVGWERALAYERLKTQPGVIVPEGARNP